MVLNKRIFREFKDNVIKYIGLLSLVLLASMSIVGFGNLEECVMLSINNVATECNREDGNFTLSRELDNTTLNKIKELGIVVEENYYSDYKLAEDKTIRLFKERENINKINLLDGKKLTDSNNIIIDELFGKANNYNIGSSLKILNEKYNISGYGFVPDYTSVSKELTDTPNHSNFGIGFVSKEKFSNLKDVKYSYSFKLNNISSDKLKNILNKTSALTSFMVTKDNPRIISVETEMITNKAIGTMVGIILSIMMAFIVSMTVITMIEKESAVIGTLYSLGYEKKELLSHFIILPTVIVSVGAICGYFLGFLLKDHLIVMEMNFFNFPRLQPSYSIKLIVMGIALPILIVLTVNYSIISKKLNTTPLRLLRKEKKESNLTKIKINYFGFINKFRIREFLREINSSIILFIGLSIAVLFLVLAFMKLDSAISYADTVKNEATIEYTYILKIPIHIKESKKIEKTVVEGLDMYNEFASDNMDVTLQGINENSNFYNFNICDDDDGAYISDSVSKKFDLKIGDTLNLKNTSEKKTYSVKVNGIVNYSNGLYIFMNRSQMNILTNKSKDYYNGYLSREPLNINKDYLASTILASDIIESANNSVEMASSTMSFLIILSVITAGLVIYLLLKFMVDKSTSNISLMKIFGFNKSELNKLYLGSHFYIIAISVIINMFIALKIVKILFFTLMVKSPSHMEMILSTTSYIIVFMIVIAIYFVIKILLKKNIDKISLSVVLKDRE
ncbi:FtsX-like permease family protein [Clostridium saccharoperbutylacetonicum]|uniref:ABC transporter permease n=1 Tax=Clostridium saccharoperbutylacetonicum TaxID=36745 RepID=UPI0039E99806